MLAWIAISMREVTLCWRYDLQRRCSKRGNSVIITVVALITVGAGLAKVVVRWPLLQLGGEGTLILSCL